MEIPPHREFCKGDCLDRHERKHVADQSSCCVRFAICVKNNPDIRACTNAWNNSYVGEYRPWFECRARTVEAECLLDTKKKFCRGDDSSKNEKRCPDWCCIQLRQRQGSAEKERDKECLKAKELGIYWGTPKCPFDKNGKIISPNPKD
jgi:hypothetical protein